MLQRSLMPGILIKLNYALSTEEMTKTSMLKQVIEESRRNTFVTGIQCVAVCCSVLQCTEERTKTSILKQVIEESRRNTFVTDFVGTDWTTLPNRLQPGPKLPS